MSAELVEFEHEGSWKGGSKPFGPSYGKLMMWFFLVSDAFTFGTFLIAYGGLRFTQDWWPDPAEVLSSFPGIDGHLPLAFVTLMTFILIASSYTMVMAVYEGHHGNRKSVIWWLLATVVGGAAFLGCQAIEWTHLMHQGLSFWNNPFQPGADGISTVVRSAEELLRRKISNKINTFENLSTYETRMQNNISFSYKSKVKIKKKSNGKGQIIFNFKNQDHLNEILDKFDQ